MTSTNTALWHLTDIKFQACVPGLFWFLSVLIYIFLLFFSYFLPSSFFLFIYFCKIDFFFRTVLVTLQQNWTEGAEISCIPAALPTRMKVKVSCTVVSDSLQFHGLQPIRPLCPWNSPGKRTGVGCHLLLQGIFLTWGSNPGSCTAGRFFTNWATRKAPTGVASRYQHLHQSVMFVSVDEASGTYNHSESMAQHTMVLSWCCPFHKLGQMYQHVYIMIDKVFCTAPSPVCAAAA